VASRSSNNVKFVEKLFQKCNYIHLNNAITKDELIDLNTMIEKFKKNN